MTNFDRVALLLLGILLFAPGINSRDLWNPDEPRYAQIAREMLDNREFLVPHLNGRVYTEKPPLHFWSIALFGWLRGGVDEVAARLPSLFFAVATLFVLFELTRLLLDARSAWWATLIFGSTAKILWQARVGQIDMGLTFWVTLAMLSVVRRVVRGAKQPAWGFWVATGLGTLAKGPVALLPPLLGLVAWGRMDRSLQLKQILRPLPGFLLWVLIVLSWLVPASLRAGGEYFETLLFKQNLERYADPWHHHQPWYYYLTILPADFFPWSFFLPGALLLRRRLSETQRRTFDFSTCWALATLLFFSLSPAKRTVYILTMYPALALLVSLSFREMAREAVLLRRWLLIPTGVHAFLLTVSAAIVGWILFYPPQRLSVSLDALEFLGPGWRQWVLLVAIVLSFGALVALFHALRNEPGKVVLSLFLSLAVTATIVSLWVLPRFDPVKSPRSLALTFLQQANATDPYAIWPRLDANVVFYTGRFATEIRTEAELRQFAQGPGRRWLFAKRDRWQKLDPPITGFREVARDADSREGYLLLLRENRPAGG
jgi:4-amino-4-deoxy-L-arabinose transferase-like glycosyltransferase